MISGLDPQAEKQKNSDDFIYIRNLLNLKHNTDWKDIYNKFKDSDQNLEQNLINSGVLTTNNNVMNKFAEFKTNINVNTEKQYSILHLVPTDNEGGQDPTLIGQISIEETGHENGLTIHTEPALVESTATKMMEMQNQITNFDLYWYTKNSPCLTPSIKGSQSCFKVMLSKCKEWLKTENTNEYKGRCYIGFDTYWGFNGRRFLDLIKKEHPEADASQEQNLRRNIFYFALQNIHLFNVEEFQAYASFVHLQ